MKIVLAQINPTVGDILGNYKKIINNISKFNNNADLIVFPELSISGYPLEDLVLKDSFLNEISFILNKLSKYCLNKNIAVIIGAPLKENNLIYNAGIFLYKKKKALIYKNNLPNYGVFDEQRVFKSGKKYNIINYKGLKLGLLICEDMWFNSLPLYLKKNGANIFICINASPYEKEKLSQRIFVSNELVKRTKVPLLYLNQVGGQDELVFDGNSFYMDIEGNIVDKCNPWKEEFKAIDFPVKFKRKNINNNDLSKISEFNTWSALTLGLKDYFTKNSFSKIVLGLSGGIDSAVSAAIAVDAIGSKNVIGILMPSKYSSKDSLVDAKETAKLLKIKTKIFKIEDIHNVFYKNLDRNFSNKVKNITDENIQSRIRGAILMAYSNNFSYLLISTGNKSEISVGYSTIYGDMNGGFNAIKDIYKTELYNLANWRNSTNAKYFKGPKGKVIPQNSINKSPSAELRPNQKDTDSLPAYDVLDKILYFLIEKELSIKDIIKKGFKASTVKRVSSLLFKSEYKRRQAPPGVKLSIKAFGKERRYPITNKFEN